MRNRSWIYVILMIVTLTGMSLLLSQVPAQAGGGAVSCSSRTSKTADTDGDGFSDYDECYGIKLFNGDTFLGYNSKGSFPRAGYLDPNSKDLFVILLRSDDPGGLGGGSTKMPPPTGSQRNSPADVAYWFPYVSNPVGQNSGQFGLGTAVHLITAAQADPGRIVCYNSIIKCTLPTNQIVPQRAVKITESLDQTADNILGYTSLCGTPNGPDLTTVYTQKIYNLLKSTLKTAPTQAQMDQYTIHTIAHEIGHTVGPLAPVNNSQYGPYHYQSADNNLIMDQSVYVSGTTFYVGTHYTADDQAAIHLK